jgi:CRP-like cAMP-binding protein
MQDVVKIKPGSTLFHQGDHADVAYFVISGRVEISVNENGQRRVLDVVSANTIIGEMGLIDPAPRMATATAIEPTEYRIVTAANLTKMVSSAPKLAVYILRSLIRTSRLRVGLPALLHADGDEKIDKVDQGFLDRRLYKPDEFVFREGDDASGLFLVQSGEIDIRKAGSQKSLRTFAPGEVFGERALLDSSPRAADAIAITPATCAFIPADRFNEVLRHTPPILVGLMRIYVKAY